MDNENRVVVLIDMDCFYCQVEEKLNPDLRGKPIAVVQYNPWKGGGIIAVNYVARAMGVTRSMRGDEAKEKCPEIQLPSVPCLRGKADITKYREAGKDVAKVLQKFTPLLERGSIDEAYLDITAPVNERLKRLNLNTVSPETIPKNTFALGYDSVEAFISDVHACGNDSIDFEQEHARQLLVGALIVSEIRAAVYEETGFRCSAGIAHNKILAKLVCGMNKPNKQTILPKHCINILYKTLPVKKVKHLGGKFGFTVREKLKINTMAELQQFTEKELQLKFDEKNGSWLYNIARGIDMEQVQARFNPKSIGCCKNFKGKAALLDLNSLKKWLKELADEIEDRLEKDALENNRTPKQMVVSFSTQLPDGSDLSSSRSYNFAVEEELCGELFTNKAFELLIENTGGKLKDGEGNRKLKAPIKFLGISVGKFEDNTESKKIKKIVDYFGAGTSKNNTTKDLSKHLNDSKCTNHGGKEYILKKFFQVTNQNAINKTNTERTSDINAEPTTITVKVNSMESTLDKQESFFAKFLNTMNKDRTRTTDGSASSRVTEESVNRSTTPLRKEKDDHGDSNDTDQSGSTINNEINKSRALFDDELDECDNARASNIRQLLRSSVNVVTDKADTVHVEPPAASTSRLENETPVGNTTSCLECGKMVPVDMLETHSDYHLALKLRDEERQLVRKEIKDKSISKVITSDNENKVKTVESNVKNEKTPSIANFFVKIDSTVPVEKCSECNKKIPIDKFAEHLDFHEAQKLRRELNKNNPVQNSAHNNVKRKRKSTSPVKKTKMPCKSIDSFFK